MGDGALIAPYRCSGDEVGVVAMLVLPQPRMLCAVFSDGSFILRLISSSNSEFVNCWAGGERIVVQENLLADRPLPECFGRAARETGSKQMKLTDAKISYVYIV